MKLDGALVILSADIVVAFPHTEGMIKQALAHPSSLPAPPKRTNFPDEPDLLAAVYARFVSRLAGLKGGVLRANPSGYVETQGAFAQRVAREVRARVAWTCDLELPLQQDFSEPLRRVNAEPAAPQIPDWNERAAWDAFTEFYAPRQK